MWDWRTAASRRRSAGIFLRALHGGREACCEAVLQASACARDPIAACHTVLKQRQMRRGNGEQCKQEEDCRKGGDHQPRRQSAAAAIDMESQQLSQTQGGQQDQDIHPQELRAESRSIKIVDGGHGGQ